MGHTANTDEDTLKAYSSLLRDVAEKEGRPAGAPLEYDLACYKHQVQGVCGNDSEAPTVGGRQDIPIRRSI